MASLAMSSNGDCPTTVCLPLKDPLDLLLFMERLNTSTELFMPMETITTIMEMKTMMITTMIMEMKTMMITTTIMTMTTTMKMSMVMTITLMMIMGMRMDQAHRSSAPISGAI